MCGDGCGWVGFHQICRFLFLVYYKVAQNPFLGFRHRFRVEAVCGSDPEVVVELVIILLIEMKVFGFIGFRTQ